MEKLTIEELTKEDLEELSGEELVDLKVKLEELIMDCEEILQEGNE